MNVQRASSSPSTPITISLCAEERAGMQRLLGLYAQCVQRGLPPSPDRRDELTALSRLRAKLATLETMQDGQGLEIDAASLLIVQHACAFFIAGAGFLPFAEQEQGVLRAAAAEVQCVVLEVSASAAREDEQKGVMVTAAHAHGDRKGHHY